MTEYEDLRKDVDELKKKRSAEIYLMPLVILVVGSTFTLCQEFGKIKQQESELYMKIATSEDRILALDSLEILGSVDKSVYDELIERFNEEETPDRIESTPSVAVAPPADSQEIKCLPYPGNKSEASRTQNVLGDSRENWHPVVASLRSESKARAYANELTAQIGEPGYEGSVYRASDAQGNRVWAVTLGRATTREEAIARVCRAQTELGLDPQSYIWASNHWELVGRPTPPPAPAEPADLLLEDLAVRLTHEASSRDAAVSIRTQLEALGANVDFRREASCDRSHQSASDDTTAAQRARIEEIVQEETGEQVILDTGGWSSSWTGLRRLDVELSICR